MSMYTPESGDVVWLNFNPKLGHEQAGLRPAVIVSPASYNKKVGLALCCPVTSQEKGYPFEVKLPDGMDVKGVVLSDQLKSLDWRARKAKRMCKLPLSTMNEIKAKILAILKDE